MRMNLRILSPTDIQRQFYTSNCFYNDKNQSSVFFKIGVNQLSHDRLESSLVPPLQNFFYERDLRRGSVAPNEGCND